MLKILLLAAVLVVVYFTFFKKKSLSNKRGDEDMVACAKCGTYVQLKESIIKNSNYYCSKECAL